MRRFIPFVFSLSFLAAASAADAADARRPNILFILADDLGYGDLGCYGQEKIKTPNIDRLAAEGIRFTSAYAGSTVCAPSRCALMTGLDTGRARIRGNSPRVALRAEDATVAEILKGAGYRTALFGKWGLGDEGTGGTPLKKGFDEFAGFLDQAHAHEHFPSMIYQGEKKSLIQANIMGTRGVYAQDMFTNAALNFIERQTSERPFFLYLAYTIPHAHNELGDEGMEVPNDLPYSDEPWPQPERNFAAMITRLDADVGKLMALLTKKGMDERTLVVFTSDNGPHREGGHSPAFFNSSGPLRGLKRSLYEGGVRVPAIARWSGRIPAGKTSDAPWAFWDFLPTAAELAGAAAPPNLTGRSVVPTLLGTPQDAAPHYYWEFHEGCFAQAARSGNWKAVRRDAGKPLELYDLAADPGERDDVAGQNADVIAKMEAILAAARAPSEYWPKPPK